MRNQDNYVDSRQYIENQLFVMNYNNAEDFNVLKMKLWVLDGQIRKEEYIDGETPDKDVDNPMNHFATLQNDLTYLDRYVRTEEGNLETDPPEPTFDELWNQRIQMKETFINTINPDTNDYYNDWEQPYNIRPTLLEKSDFEYLYGLFQTKRTNGEITTAYDITKNITTYCIDNESVAAERDVENHVSAAQMEADLIVKAQENKDKNDYNYVFEMNRHHDEMWDLIEPLKDTFNLPPEPDPNEIMDPEDAVAEQLAEQNLDFSGIVSPYRPEELAEQKLDFNPVEAAGGTTEDETITFDIDGSELTYTESMSGATADDIAAEVSNFSLSGYTFSNNNDGTVTVSQTEGNGKSISQIGIGGTDPNASAVDVTVLETGQAETPERAMDSGETITVNVGGTTLTFTAKGRIVYPEIIVSTMAEEFEILKDDPAGEENHAYSFTQTSDNVLNIKQNPGYGVFISNISVSGTYSRASDTNVIWVADGTEEVPLITVSHRNKQKIVVNLPTPRDQITISKNHSTHRDIIIRETAEGGYRFFYRDINGNKVEGNGLLPITDEESVNSLDFINTVSPDRCKRSETYPYGELEDTWYEVIWATYYERVETIESSHGIGDGDELEVFLYTEKNKNNLSASDESRFDVLNDRWENINKLREYQISEIGTRGIIESMVNAEIPELLSDKQEHFATKKDQKGFYTNTVREIRPEFT